MEMEAIERELVLLLIYLKSYNQLLEFCTNCGGYRIKPEQMPTFEYFKETMDDPRYSMVIPNYQDSFFKVGDELVINHSKGIGSGGDPETIRYYNYWNGCKYYV